MEKEQKINRIRKPIHLTLSKDTISLLKNTGNNASKVIDSLVKDAFSESRPVRVLIGETGWARRDSGWDQSNRAYILTHGVSGVAWSHYKHPLPENVYQVYMKYWMNEELMLK